MARPTARPQEERELPSDYLRAHCPLCFGGNDWQKARSPDQSFDCIVCMDACFTQKHLKNPHGAEGDDPPNPITLFFVPTEVVDELESLTEQCHSGRVVAPDGIEDVVEEGMCVPVSVLDGCGQSFIAADERQEKASTQFF
ncbi:hypothetical protein BDN67DRAFT_913722, partial [Paxillus ammoniavirescens]